VVRSEMARHDQVGAPWLDVLGGRIHHPHTLSLWQDEVAAVRVWVAAEVMSVDHISAVWTVSMGRSISWDVANLAAVRDRLACRTDY
jgi:hypothetical protein